MRGSLTLLLLAALGCVQPRSPDDRAPQPPLAVSGAFTSGHLAGSAGGITVDGHFLWHASIGGSQDGITIRRRESLPLLRSLQRRKLTIPNFQQLSSPCLQLRSQQARKLQAERCHWIDVG